jgi:hypothetical protein
MKRCLSDQDLLQSYTGEGAPEDQAHLKSCLTCAGRYKQLQRDMGTITQALDAAPPRRRERAAARWFVPWRVPVLSAAVMAAFIIGWSLRGVSLDRLAGSPAHVALHQPDPSRAPVQLSALEPGNAPSGASPAIYAEYVQGAFGEESCSEANDPLEPGCL